MIEWDKTITCSMLTRMGTLTDVPCCDSCHEDADSYGYDLFEIQWGPWIVLVCCRKAEAFDKTAPPPVSIR